MRHSYAEPMVSAVELKLATQRPRLEVGEGELCYQDGNQNIGGLIRYGYD